MVSPLQGLNPIEDSFSSPEANIKAPPEEPFSFEKNEILTLERIIQSTFSNDERKDFEGIPSWD